MNGVRRVALIATGIAVCLSLPGAAQAQAQALEAAPQARLDMVWVLLSAALVFFMQTGFLLLEAGMVRSKNSINVAQKNFLDFMASGLVFAAVGFMIAFGQSAASLPVGWDHRLFLLSDLDPWLCAFFVFQVMFCGTAATIVSGAVAERMKLSSYVICAVALAGLIYPVFTHWAWGAALGANAGAFLANLGYIDFAGSTVVHATGGWFALAACIILGPRLGRFGPDGEVRRMTGHNPVLATSGALVLFVGWIGFNGGSTLAANGEIAHIILNTILAGCAGGFAGYICGWAADGVVLPDKAVNGCIAGLVAITAGCAVLNPPTSVAIGAIGALVAIAGNAWLERMRVDDAVGAIGVHGFAGVAGTIGLALLAPAEHLAAGGRAAQIGVQSLGVALNFVWSFGVGLAFFALLNLLQRIRVSADAEMQGLNEAEHATRLGIGHVEEAFGSLVDGSPDLETRLVVEPGDEAENLTRIFNALMDNLQADEKIRQQSADAERSEAEAQRMSALANTTFEALCLSVDGVIMDANQSFADLVALPITALRDRNVWDFIAHDRSEDREHIEALEATGHCEITVVNAEGVRIPVEVRSREIIYRGRQTRLFAMSDLRERKKAEERIRYMAQHDTLSGLPNRALFNERLDSLTERTPSEGLMSALMLIDLDRFKDINDLYGHQAGDEVIKVAAERLRMVIRSSDMAARLGGDEFAILQVGIDFANQAADLAHRLVQDLSGPITLPNGSVLRPGASIGVAICPRDGADSPTLISRADTALYHAKHSGRNTFSVFETGMDAENRRRQMLEADLAGALSRDEFDLYFQPRLRLSDGEIVSYEALLRWRHPVRGVIGPGEFISVAEQSGRIVPIGDWVMRAACRHSVEQLGSIRVSVNVSPLQFRERNFLDRVAAALKDSGLPPSRLEIEITEGTLIADDKRAIELLIALKEIGVEIALDDFGTGYSSLSYLSRFPFDTLKVDRSFVSGITDNANSRAIVETVVRLGNALDMNVVAEGVEETSELQLLAALGCDEAQGYLIGRPQPLSAVARHAPLAVSAALGREPQQHDDDPQGRAVLALQRRVEALLADMPLRTAEPSTPTTQESVRLRTGSAIRGLD